MSGPARLSILKNEKNYKKFCTFLLSTKPVDNFVDCFCLKWSTTGADWLCPQIVHLLAIR